MWLNKSTKNIIIRSIILRIKIKTTQKEYTFKIFNHNYLIDSYNKKIKK